MPTETGVAGGAASSAAPSGAVREVEVPAPDAGVDAPGEPDPEGGASAAAVEGAAVEGAAVEGAAVEGAAEDHTPPAMSHPLVREFLTGASDWPIWSAVALLRWMMARMPSSPRLVYRSRPSLGFSGSEIHDVGVADDALHLVLSAPGLAAPGSALPLSDIARIVADAERPGGGALAYWLDGLVDRLMQAVEAAEARTNASFALATGRDLQVVDSVLNLAGLSAPLLAEPGGVLRDALGGGGGLPVPGLGRLFAGAASAAGLESLVSAFTGLDVEVEEFVPVPLQVAEPLSVGGVLGGLAIGREGEAAAAGVNVVLDGADSPEAIEWARDPERSRSLAYLCESYVGGPTPTVFLYVDAAPEYVPRAALRGRTALGRAPVLGRAAGPMRIPIEGGADGDLPSDGGADEDG